MVVAARQQDIARDMGRGGKVSLWLARLIWEKYSVSHLLICLRRQCTRDGIFYVHSITKVRGVLKIV